MARKAFVCGHPIAHSRSPDIHGYWLRKYGIAGSYEAIDVAPADIRQFFSTLGAKGFAGGNVTIPHKEAAYAAVGRRDEAAEKIGAVNTLWFEDGVLCGGNTDAEGFAANLDGRAPGWANSGAAVVLGAGGAARAVIHALKQRGFSDIRVVNRTVSRAAELAGRFGLGVSAHRSRRRANCLAMPACWSTPRRSGYTAMRNWPSIPNACRTARSSPTSSMCRWRRRCLPLPAGAD